MRFSTSALSGPLLIQPMLLEDERGFFARWYCKETFKRHGLTNLIEQGNLSYSHKKGTLRGLHLQTKPAKEAKLIRCSQGSILDIIVDCREDSPTQFQWETFTLSAENRTALYIPEGFAHGYMTLEDKSEIFYLVSEKYNPTAEIGFRYDDPTINLKLPFTPSIISSKDRSWDLLLNKSKEIE